MFEPLSRKTRFIRKPPLKHRRLANVITTVEAKQIMVSRNLFSEINSTNRIAGYIFIEIANAKNNVLIK
jgi:hypothetical protein